MGGRINTSLVTLQELKEKYDNIHLISFNLDDYMAGTPLEYWYHCNGWRDGPFHVSHLSDGLRFLTLHKYGGYYFDLDVISVRPVTDLRNFVAAESDDYLGSGVLHAEFKNPVMELAVKDFAANYRQVEPIDIIFPPNIFEFEFVVQVRRLGPQRSRSAVAGPEKLVQSPGSPGDGLCQLSRVQRSSLLVVLPRRLFGGDERIFHPSTGQPKSTVLAHRPGGRRSYLEQVDV
jgi:lactosylceramide 4-alpha-galactosyltransferase